jgi:hypothetical protein
VSLDLFTELQSLTAALDAAGLEYALVGALALAVHGAPRATTDIDVLVCADVVEPALAIARGLGFDLEANPMAFADGLHMRRVTKLEAGDAVTLDLLVVNPNLEVVWASREAVETEVGRMWVISREALIAMKLSAGRTRDIADVERLRELDR